MSPRRVGHPTRGKTAPNRLRRTGIWLLVQPPAALRAPDPLVVDLGYGADPTTTLELDAQLRAHRPGLRMVGVEIDPVRVAVATPYADPPRREFRLGGFELPLAAGERPAVIRAMNVLRQYDEDEHHRATAMLMARLAPGGVLVEGTSSPTGSLLTFHVRHAPGAERADLLVFAPNLRRLVRPGTPPWSPRSLQTVLPKDRIHRAGPGTPLDRFFTDWERSWRTARATGLTHAAALARCAEELRGAGHPVVRSPALVRRGFIAVTP